MQDKRLLIGELFAVYGAILSEKQRLALEFYYNDDLSLSEVAENMGITRQGVRDLLVHGEEQLFLYEEKLGVYAGNRTVRDIAARIAGMTDDAGIKELASRLMNTETKKE